jgi:hypothetical protein
MLCFIMLETWVLPSMFLPPLYPSLIHCVCDLGFTVYIHHACDLGFMVYIHCVCDLGFMIYIRSHTHMCKCTCMYYTEAYQ